MFITFEGLDGAGKTTQSRMLYEYLITLHGQGNVILTREPGGTKSNELIRDVLLHDENIDRKAELLFFIAMRREHLVKVIKPALEQNKVVVCDRFIDSTIAYQGYGYGTSIKLIQKLNKLAIGPYQPDLTFIIDYEMTRSFISHKINKYEKMDEKFYHRVKEGFLNIALDSGERCIVVRKSDDAAVTHSEVVGLLRSRLMH